MKINGLQIFWLIFTFETGNMLLLTINPLISDAKQDAWISALVAIVPGIIIVLIASKVSLLYPNQTLIEFSKTILGKWIGTIIVMIYFIQWYSVIGNILGEFAEFTILILLPNTPSWILILTMLLLMIYVTYIAGIEGIARCSEVFGPIVLLMVILLFILSIPNMEFRKILPIYSDTGLTTIIKGSLSPLSFLGETVLMMMIISFMDRPKQGPLKAIWGIALSGFLVSTTTLSVIMVFGPEVAKNILFPAFDTIRFISVMNFIQNLEIVAVLIWILSVFIKVSLYFFSASYGTAQLLKIKDWRKAIWFVAIVTFLLGIYQPTITLIGIEYVKEYWVKYVMPVNMVGIPLLLLVVGSIRKRMTNSKNA
ncbi:endospore germination permease [Bacillus sp. DTU_2020_1000418_1_SI_GHA_SEK_038]|uniref:GerAB/ArcD/ProY family transporter n=1 Tax=Bacillus sp. DTU_2020_1000418_1_SI_GHA_SEK_038 TaxID=3077585 RepID=UPI0028E9519E|nr:endospore germination permease [Bacillus sp. DTU_2020_1000418_1_SI_GHA_SEK_038]WNS77460.1 endospore germination permease [Bacillus sp. DTU_2020_1000418_1_SI_GHA_SEK_038]